MQKYKHLCFDQRKTIEFLHQQGKKQQEIADILNVHKSTICRELNRNSSKIKQLYQANTAQIRADERKKFIGRNPLIVGEMEKLVKEKLNLQWSPDQIYNHCKLKGLKMACHETIYLYIYKDKKKGGNLFKNLRQSHACRRRRLNKYKKRGIIKNRTPIEDRPQIINEQKRYGDFEGDTIIGKNHKGAMATLVDRKSLLTIIAPLKNKNAVQLSKKVVRKLKHLKKPVHSITFDNGLEFANHEFIAKKLNIQIFFARPYHSQDRGCNENINGLIRQYLPKKTDFSTITNLQVEHIENLLNNRPRKKLGYKTPYEVFFQNNFENST